MAWLPLVFLYHQEPSNFWLPCRARLVFHHPTPFTCSSLIRKKKEKERKRERGRERKEGRKKGRKGKRKKKKKL